MSSEPAISIRGISKRFEMYSQPRDRLFQFLSLGKRQYFKEFWALRDISFDIQKGETVGVLGRNGSGKSTLLQIIAGTLSPTFGEVTTKGTLAALLELGSGFNAEFTGRENIYLNGAILGFSEQQMDARIDRIVEFADIGEHLDQPVKTYSSGMYVRLAFAVQACVEPEILIVDEALSVGDEKFQRKCFEHIEGLRSRGCSVLIVTHSTATVEKFCQKAALLHKGELHGYGAANEIIDQYHALLYSDEKAYLRYLNQISGESIKKDAVSTLDASRAVTSAEPDAEPKLRAIISHWQMFDQHDVETEAFRSGQQAMVRFTVEVFDDVDEIQAGILIRTVEGVSAFGTSTRYHHSNWRNASSGAVLEFDFTVCLDLGPGAYFVSLAVAEVVGLWDMQYLDKKTDAIVIQVSQPRLKGTGIAALDCSVVARELTVS